MDSREALLQQAHDLHHACRPQEANARYRHILKRFPGDLDALHMLAVTEFQLGNPRFALKVLQNALAIEPGNGALTFRVDNFTSAMLDKFGGKKPGFKDVFAMVGRNISEKDDDQISLEDFLPLFYYGMVLRDSRGAKLFDNVCRSYSINHKNVNCLPWNNGERWLLGQIVDASPAVFFDVGANDGLWADFAASYHPEARIHCFEIVPSVFEKLRDKFKDNGNVVCSGVGLSDHASDQEIVFVDPSATFLSSTISAPNATASPVRCRVMRGDDYVRENGIDRIDFLKIDVEGAEQAVLNGFRESISAGMVDMIQIEYSTLSISSHTLLKDHYDFLEPLGFVVGKLYPEGVKFKSYEPMDEDFLGFNYIACRTSRKDLIDRVSYTEYQ